MAENVTGLVLSSAASDEPQAIPGLPGLWATTPELSVVPADHGFDLDELTARAEELGLAVERVEWEREIEDETGAPLTLDEISERVESFSDEELAQLSADERKGARVIAERETARRAEAAAGPAESETEGGS